MTAWTTAESSSAMWRGLRVEELERHFIARGVSRHTARAWAEAETPPEYITMTISGTNRMTRILPLLILSACAPAVDRQDCTDAATWRQSCESRDVTRAAPEPEEPGGHWATRDNEPDSRTDPEGHRDWQRDRDAQREEGTW